jgi:hypothetical protein
MHRAKLILLLANLAVLAALLGKFHPRGTWSDGH